MWNTVSDVQDACRELGEGCNNDFYEAVDDDRYALQLAFKYSKQGMPIFEAMWMGMAAAAGAGVGGGSGRSAPTFVHGGTFERTFGSPIGTIEVYAEVVVRGNTLYLNNVLAYPRGFPDSRGMAGTAAILQIRREVAAMARAQGFHVMVVDVYRTSGNARGQHAPIVINLTPRIPPGRK